MAAPFQWSLAALETLMAEDQVDQHAAVLRAFSVVELCTIAVIVAAPPLWVWAAGHAGWWCLAGGSMSSWTGVTGRL